MQSAQMAYDRAITVFSPDGRLFQVEYAREAVKRGTTAIGITYKGGAILVADKRIRGGLVDDRSIEKIFLIDGHVGAATSGLIGDARVLIDYARVQAQSEKVTYGQEITVESLVKKVCDLLQQYTQYGGVRPFGASLLIAGIEETGIRLFETDPSGLSTGYKADAIGAGRDAAMEILEKEYRDNLELKEAADLAIKALKAGLEQGQALGTLSVGLITKEEKFKILSPEESKKLIGA
ncbi:MAG: archaeal proteasome endopeptidase complex subunit alpha [Candidatus Thermoplasmatota archaeon]|jgi:proteasome alpha subunit|nr:archaeal proteasome endopeptidase complex subunit alpha [Candidatus Thermoplasmatota archaeon]